MEVSYHPGQWPLAEVVASPTEYEAMAERVSELARAGSGDAVFPACGGRLVVRVASGPLVVAATAGGALSVCGGPEAVGLFALNMPSEPALPTGYHVHLEHAGREQFVAAESVPLVLMVASG